ncbi:MAG TPA: thiamine phosphate synthase [Candidatus Binatia bacterium]|nr:thiamine phosphate synthase [Candidatus Binatia bacterium]
MPTPDFDLYLVTDRSQTRGRDLLWVLERALEGGVRAIQLREKDLSGKDLFQLAAKTRELCDRYDAQLFVNDRIDVALAVDAAGVQLGKTSVPIETTRALVGPQKLIGYSAHSLEEAQIAQQIGTDFVLFGPVYFTQSKARYGMPQGPGALKKIVENVALPVYAIGGIKPENIIDVRLAGARGVALISAIIGADRPDEAAREMVGLLQR